MGGFYPSKNLEKILTDYNENQRYLAAEWMQDFIPDDIYEVIEQCIVMTKVFETGDYDKFLDFSKAFTGKYPAVERMLQHSNFSSEKPHLETLSDYPVDHPGGTK